MDMRKSMRKMKQLSATVPVLSEFKSHSASYLCIFTHDSIIGSSKIQDYGQVQAFPDLCLGLKSKLMFSDL